MREYIPPLPQYVLMEWCLIDVTDDRGFESRQWLFIFLLTTSSKPALGPTQPHIHWVPGTLSLGVKQPGREADHLPPSSTEVKNAWNYTSTPPIRLHGVVLSLKKNRDNFTFTLTYSHQQEFCNPTGLFYLWLSKGYLRFDSEIRLQLLTL
jgi:hypothetical protein